VVNSGLTNYNAAQAVFAGGTTNAGNEIVAGVVGASGGIVASNNITLRTSSGTLVLTTGQGTTGNDLLHASYQGQQQSISTFYNGGNWTIGMTSADDPGNTAGTLYVDQNSAAFSFGPFTAGTTLTAGTSLTVGTTAAFKGALIVYSNTCPLGVVGATVLWNSNNVHTYIIANGSTNQLW
jgi:hypothetical protein